MKIAYDHQIFYSQVYGGISRYYVNLAEQLLEMNQSVQIIAPMHCNMYLDELKQQGAVYGFKIGNKKSISRAIAKFSNGPITKHKLKQLKPQILHKTYYSHITVAKSDMPIVVTVYDMIHEIYKGKYFPSNDKTYARKKRAIERADHIICISERTRSDLVKLLEVPVKKTSVVHLACTHYHGEKNTTNILDYPYIIYVGERSGYKNFHRFIDAFSASALLKKDFRIVAFGGVPFKDHELKQFKRNGLNIESIVHLTGSDHLLANLYRNARMLIYPSEYEGFGLPPLEAMSYDCPVVSSHGGSMPEIIGDAGEYFDPLLVEDITRAIKNVAYDKTRSTELVNCGREQIKRYSWRKCAEETLSVYRTLIHEIN